MASAELMGSVYWQLMTQLESIRFDVFGPHRTRLSKARKLRLVLRAWYRSTAGVLTPNYGTP